MWWLYVLIGLAVLIAALLIMPVQLTLSFSENSVITLGYLFIKRQLYPAVGKQARAKKARRAEKKQKRPEKQEREPKAEDAVNMLGVMKDIIIEILRRAKKLVAVRLKKLILVIGTDEAAKTAQLYGAAAIAYDELAEALRRTSNYKEKAGAVNISVDFTSEKTVFEALIVLRAGAISALRIILPAIIKNINKIR